MYQDSCLVLCIFFTIILLRLLTGDLVYCKARQGGGTKMAIFRSKYTISAIGDRKQTIFRLHSHTSGFFPELNCGSPFKPPMTLRQPSNFGRIC